MVIRQFYCSSELKLESEAIKVEFLKVVCSLVTNFLLRRPVLISNCANRSKLVSFLACWTRWMLIAKKWYLLPIQCFGKPVSLLPFVIRAKEYARPSYKEREKCVLHYTVLIISIRFWLVTFISFTKERKVPG